MTEEQPAFPERLPVTEREVIDALNEKGIGDPEARALLERYADQCQAEADIEMAAHQGDSVVSLRANARCSITLARLYMQTRDHKLFVRRELENAEGMLLHSSAAHGSGLVEDLLQEIGDLMDAMKPVERARVDELTQIIRDAYTDEGAPHTHERVLGFISRLKQRYPSEELDNHRLYRVLTGSTIPDGVKMWFDLPGGEIEAFIRGLKSEN